MNIYRYFLHLKTLYAFYQLQREGKLAPSDLQQLIYTRLQTVLISAYQHVPYYREQMQHLGYNPTTDYQGPLDLSRLPLLSKAIIKQRGLDAFIKEGTNLARTPSTVTSGSTGVPMRLYQSAADVANRTARTVYIGWRNGYGLTDKVLGIAVPGRLPPGVHRLRRYGLFPKMVLDCAHYSIAELVDTLLIYKPAALYGNRGVLSLMALELRRRNISPEQVGLKFLSGGAEVFHENDRQLYRQQFGVELLDMYGSTELALMAYETVEHDGLHLFENLIYDEVLDEEGRPVPCGVPGRLVVTDITRTLMPFIRYAQGDLVVVQEIVEPSGRRARRITQVVGREETDYILLPDGTKTTVFQIIGVLKNYVNIAQFRALQRTPHQIDVFVVATPEYFSEVSRSILQDLQRNFPPTLTINLKLVDQLDLDPNGKLKTFISEIPKVVS